MTPEARRLERDLDRTTYMILAAIVLAVVMGCVDKATESSEPPRIKAVRTPPAMGADNAMTRYF